MSNLLELIYDTVWTKTVLPVLQVNHYRAAVEGGAVVDKCCNING